MGIYHRHQRKPIQGTGLDRAHGLVRGLAAFWPFNEGAGLPFDYAAGVASVSNSATWASSPYGPALEFNGTNEYVNIGSPPGLQIAGPISVAFAGAPSATAGFQSILDCRNSVLSAGWAVSIDLDGNNELSLFTDPGNLYAVSSNSIADGNWHVFGLSLATNNGTGGATCFRDGVPFGVSNVAFPAANTSGNLASIGAKFGAVGPHWFSGPLGWLGVWNRALSAAEHAELARNPWQVFRPRTLVSPFAGTAAVPLAAGTATVGWTSPHSIAVSATTPTGGTAPYSYQWQVQRAKGGYTYPSASPNTYVSARGANVTSLSGVIQDLGSITGYTIRLQVTDGASNVAYTVPVYAATQNRRWF